MVVLMAAGTVGKSVVQTVGRKGIKTATLRENQTAVSMDDSMVLYLAYL